MEALTPALIEWSVAASTLPGQAASGDGYLVKPLPESVLIAVVDGLGHGVAAAAAAALAISTLDGHHEQSVIPHVNRCHERLRGTRGAVMSVGSFSGRDSTLTWLGVGNVEGMLLRSPGQRDDHGESLLLRRGVVGAHLPTLRPSIMNVAAGDLLIVATDGIGSGFAHAVVFADPIQKIANRILAEHAKATDDALVLVSRYLGGEGVRYEEPIVSARVARGQGTRSHAARLSQWGR